jgi:transcriptional regulator with GAF, ATPase, and Fis domain
VAKKRESAFHAQLAWSLFPKPVETGSLKKSDERSVIWMVEIKPLKEVRRDHVREVLRRSGRDLDRASRILGITPDALRRIMERYEISLSDISDESES